MLSLVLLSLAAPCTATLRPIVNRTLPPTFLRARSVAWGGDGFLLIGDANGVQRYEVKTGAAERIIGPREIPKGLANVLGVGSDGKSLVAFSSDYSDIVADARTGAIRFGRRRAGFQVADLAIRGETVAVLGYPQPPLYGSEPSLWLARVGDDWSRFRSADRVPKTDMRPRLLLSSIVGYAGALAIEPNGTIDVVTGWRAGVRRYRADGTPLGSLGTGLTELVLPELPLADPRMNDLTARYQIVNRKPMADDVVATTDGPAIVVRTADATHVRWQLWFPNATGVRRRIDLGIARAGTVSGHLRCDARGARMACIYGEAADDVNAPQTPRLVVFSLDEVLRRACP